MYHMGAKFFLSYNMVLQEKLMLFCQMNRKMHFYHDKAWQIATKSCQGRAELQCAELGGSMKLCLVLFFKKDSLSSEMSSNLVAEAYYRFFFFQTTHCGGKKKKKRKKETANPERHSFLSNSIALAGASATRLCMKALYAEKDSSWLLVKSLKTAFSNP